MTKDGAVMAAPDTAAERPAGGTIRYWAAAKAAAGTAEEPYRAATLADALAAARAHHAAEPEFARVLLRCSFLVDGSPVGTRDHAAVPLQDGGTVEVLPPFAGGAR
jgi:molybdopterin converting factor small subunit